MFWQDFNLSEALSMLAELRENIPQKSVFSETEFSDFLDFVENLIWESGLE